MEKKMKYFITALALSFSFSSFASLNCFQINQIREANPLIIATMIEREEALAKKISKTLIERANEYSSWGITDEEEKLLQIEADSMIMDNNLEFADKVLDCIKEK